MHVFVPCLKINMWTTQMFILNACVTDMAYDIKCDVGKQRHHVIILQYSRENI